MTRALQTTLALLFTTTTWAAFFAVLPLIVLFIAADCVFSGCPGCLQQYLRGIKPALRESYSTALGRARRRCPSDRA